VKTYSDSCSIGKRGEAEVEKYLRQRGVVQVISSSSLPEETGKKYQRIYGDLFIEYKGKAYTVEVKTEEEQSTKNLFLETWSNKSRKTVGWMHYCEADLLAYLFLDTRNLYWCDMHKLKEWFEKNAWNYPEKPQRVTSQLNDSWGRCVPLKTLRADIGLKRRGLDACPF